MAQVQIRITDITGQGDEVVSIEMLTDWVKDGVESKAVQLGAAVIEMLNYAREYTDLSQKGD